MSIRINQIKTTAPSEEPAPVQIYPEFPLFVSGIPGSRQDTDPDFRAAAFLLAYHPGWNPPSRKHTGGKHLHVFVRSAAL